MNEQIQQIAFFLISYIVVILIGFLLMQFLSNGFFSKFLKVKASRGKKVLVKTKTMTDVYYTSGHIEEEFLVYADRQKEKRRIKISEKDTYRAIGVSCININETKSSVIRTTGEEVSGFDAIKIENLYIRAMTRPQIKDKKEQIKTVLAILVLVAVLGFFALKLTQVEEQINLIVSSLESLKVTGVIQ